MLLQIYIKFCDNHYNLSYFYVNYSNIAIVISCSYCTFAAEKSCLTANVCILQKLELLPNHYLY